MFYKLYLKRFFDLIFGIIVFPIFILLFILIAPIIFLGDRGKIFYSAPRLGINAKEFQMYKFRTMKIGAPDIRNEDGTTFNSDNDPRLTKFGKILRKTSLDELPQIFNIIKGDMSLIGPRPDLFSQIEHYDLKTETKFHVRPGLTGYAQVNGRNLISWSEKNEMDRYYVSHLSLILDVKIFFLTIVKIFMKEGVNKK